MAGVNDSSVGGGRRPAPEQRPVALTIAGSDSGGGAGIQADLQTMSACGAFPTSVVTSVTAQNSRGVDRAFTLPAEEVTAQFDAVVSDFDVAAAKTGMLAEAALVEAVTARVADADFPLVVDPVMVATSGDRLLSEAGEAAYESLVGEATLVTPNRAEASVLTGIEVTDTDSAKRAGEGLREQGADAALITGGHGDADTVSDVLVTGADVRVFEHPRVDGGATHGSGCTLSAAITAEFASGALLPDAVAAGIETVRRAVRYPLAVGMGASPVNHQVSLRNRAARHAAVETVTDIVDQLAALDVRTLVPEVGMNVVAATPAAESVDEIAAVDGRLTRTRTGITSERPVRFGASSHIARVLLAAREHDPSLRVAMNCRHDDTTAAALADLDGPVGWFERGAEPETADTMDWGTDHAFRTEAAPPVAVVDDGAVGKEPMIRLLASDPERLVGRVATLLPDE